MRDEAGFRSFVETNGATLLHVAKLLTGDHHRGEDLVQTALAKLYPKWGRVDAPLAYTRRTMVNAHIDSTRRRWWGERPTPDVPDRVDDGADDGSDLRDELRRLLAGLDARERSIVVMRYYCDLSERETAQLLKMPLGTVKSTCARALARLRVEAAGAGAGSGPVAS